MTHIRSRRHHGRHATNFAPLLNQSLVALMTIATPLAAQAQQPAVGAVSAVSEQIMPVVRVSSSAEAPYKAEKTANPKLSQPLLDTPQTVSVIKKEIIQEQGAVNIMEALRNVPGITMQLGENGNTSAGDTFQMRGFAAQTSIFADGVRDLGGVTRDTFNIEQLEVVKGPAGADVGRGATSGYINLVTKLPTLEESASASASWNSGNNKRITADLSKKTGDTSAFRLNVMGQHGGIAGRDRVENNAYGIAPSLAIGLGTPTRFYLYSQHMRVDNVPDGGVPSIGLPGFFNANAALQAGARVDSENFYGNIDDYEKVDADMVTAKIEHNFGKGKVLRNISRYGKSNIDRVLTGVNALAIPTAADPSTWTVARTRQRIDQENEILANQTSLSADFATGQVQHSLVTGLEFMYEKQLAPSFAVPAGVTIPAANLYRPDPSDILPVPVANGVFANGSTTTAALYASDAMKLSNKWILNAGLRFEHYNTETDSASGTPPVNANLSKSDNLFSWKTGLVYKPASNGSIYAAFANSLTPPGGANFVLSAANNNANNPALTPQKTTNMELGTKWDVMQKKLSLTAALYRTDNKNEVFVDQTTNIPGQFGKRRVEGVELGAIGQLTSAWQISAGVATMETKVLSAGASGNNAQGAAARWSPELTASLWSTYQWGKNWTFGGGARYMSKQKRVIDPNVATPQNMPHIPSYYVVDALVGYQAIKNMSLQLNIYNLLDKFYINTLNNSGARYTPGAPRSAMLTANILF